MKILQVRFKEGPSVSEGLTHRDQLIDLVFPAQTDFLLMDEAEFKVHEYDLVIFFPLCSAFSIDSVGSHWTRTPDKKHLPKSEKAKTALLALGKTERLVHECRLWILESPVGMMRFFWKWGHRNTITHCQYGSTRQKPTDLWSNFNWEARPMCQRGAPCHEAAPRGSRTGTQGRKSRSKKTELPLELQKTLIKEARRNDTTTDLPTLPTQITPARSSLQVSGRKARLVPEAPVSPEV